MNPDDTPVTPTTLIDAPDRRHRVPFPTRFTVIEHTHMVAGRTGRPHPVPATLGELRTMISDPDADLAGKYAPTVTQENPLTARSCPDCGSALWRGYRPTWDNTGDVEPFETCTRCAYDQDLG